MNRREFIGTCAAVAVAGKAIPQETVMVQYIAGDYVRTDTFDVVNIVLPVFASNDWHIVSGSIEDPD